MKVTRVAIVSDTHAHLDPRVADVISTCQIAIHAGDICDAGILEELQARVDTVIAVAGNNDHEHVWPHHQSHIVNQLENVEEIELPGGILVVEHGHAHGMQTPCHDSLRETHPHARAIVYGHTHKQIFDQSAEPWVINPGAAGETRTHGGPSCIVLTAMKHEWLVDLQRFPPVAA